jgi:hypothetical protein
MEKKPKNISTLKRNILKMIRNHQYDKQKNTAKKEPESLASAAAAAEFVEPKITASFDTDFNNSLKFLSELTTDVEKKKHNQTIRHYPVAQPHLPSPRLLEETPTEFHHASEDIPYMIRPPPVPILPPPKYGCLKNGSLPTYRSWVTQKVRPPIQNLNPASNITIVKPNTINQTVVRPMPIMPLVQETELDKRIKEVSKISQFEKMNQREKNTGQLSKFRFPKQKKIIRRTYCIGKSKIHPKISVLVSNKTIRANTTLKKQELKNVPMPEVRKYLLKHGFIKVGTNSPNDVLREMYENAKLIGGEIKNHNPENLLYNYFHATESDL